jgi:hypothetical protein
MNKTVNTQHQQNQQPHNIKMSEMQTLDVSSMVRSPSANRFQVNPVDKPSNGDAGGDKDHGEDDAFPDEKITAEIISRRKSKTPHIGKICGKSSFRDKDRPVRERQTSFSVAPGDDDSDSNDEAENLIYDDSKYGRSFR